jgi:hypothetical protein
MTLEWNGDAVHALIEQRAYEGLQAAAQMYEKTLRLKVSVPNPLTRGPRGGRVYLESSKPGEYPRLRTGKGQKSITRLPETVPEAIACGWVRVGYLQIDSHLLALEFAQKRKGLIDLLDEMRPQLAALATAGFKDAR